MIVVKEYDKILFGVTDDNQFLSAEEVERELEKLKEQENENSTGDEFRIIAKAKQALLDSTNIDTSPDEMACLDSFLFRCWQMGWLDKYEKDLVEVVRCKDCKWWDREEHNCVIRDSYGWDYKPTDYCSYAERKEHETSK